MKLATSASHPPLALRFASSDAAAARGTGWGGPDSVIAAALVALFGALAWGTRPERQFGDAAILIEWPSQNPGIPHPLRHVAYLPAARALLALWNWPSATEARQFLSCAAGAVGVALTYLLCKGFGASRAGAAAGALLLALSPAWWFYSVMVEVHTLHGAAVALCACVTVFGPWQHPLRASLASALFLPLVFLTHQSGVLLAPGWILLAQVGRSRQGLPPLSLKTLAVVVAPIFAAAFALALAIAILGWSHESGYLSYSEGQARVFARGFTWGAPYEVWIRPLGLLVPAAVAGAMIHRGGGWRIAAVALLLGPSLLFFVWFGLVERGGYTLGSACFLAALASGSLRGLTRRSLPLWLLVIALQAVISGSDLRKFVSQWDGSIERKRVQAVDSQIQGRGYLVSFSHRGQRIEASLPNVHEWNLYTEVVFAVEGAERPEAFARRSARKMYHLAGISDSVLLDESYKQQESLDPRYGPYFRSLESLLEQHMDVRAAEAAWPLKVLCRRRPAE